jgi:hypothetical protein
MAIISGLHENVIKAFLLPKMRELIGNAAMIETYSDGNFTTLISTTEGKGIFIQIIQFLLAFKQTYVRPFPILGLAFANFGDFIFKWMDEKVSMLYNLFNKNVCLL